MQQENADVPAGTVLQVFQVGYLIDDRCLRPAMVAVSTGGPKAAKPEAPEPPSAD
jgi:molecular chaperone GrpE